MKFQIYNVSAKIIVKAVEFSKKCEESNILFNKKLLSSSLNLSEESSRKAIGAAKQLGLFELSEDIYYASQEKKISIFRSKLLEYKPFSDFIELINNEYTNTEAINFIKSIYKINLKNGTILWTILNWGKFAGIFENIRGNLKFKDGFKIINYNQKIEIPKNNKVDDSFCFVIMSYSENLILQNSYKNVIKPIVSLLGYTCERVDEQEFNGHITEKIIDNIKKARFIISDLTEARPNCYYELGIAHGLNKDVIHIVNSISDIHFDVKDFNFIIYKSIKELKEKLKKRIQETIGYLKQ
ncbi:MAG: hypothetical protein CEE42_01355 [Promethearchaeota archaeon Loki_b31]|nr:MAG: hypothetical protein CEE42_01355 [Candidatus Lokiarchaeota archaeon Loki_b31]